MTERFLQVADLDRTYFLSADAANDAQRSLALIVYGRQCWMCRQNVGMAQAVIASPQYFLEAIADHCSQEPDYLLPDTPMKEAVFRVLLARRNEETTAEQVSEELSRRWAATQFQRDTSPRVMRRLLDSARDYYCVVSSDSGYEYRAKIGESVKPPKPPPIPPPEPRPEDPGDPFAADSDVWRPPPTSSPEENAAYERMLYWISARGEGTWAQFRDAARTLGVTKDGQEEDRRMARSAMRRMILLGHVDLSDDGERWSASRTVFVRLADDPNAVYLAGARVPSFLSGFALRKTEQLHDAGPPRLDADAAILQYLDETRALGVADAGDASERLADVLLSVDGWKDTLKAVDIAPASFDVVERYEDSEFRPCNALYTRDGRHIGESGMYRLRRESDPSGRTWIVFFDEPCQRFLRGDWYGLRFLSVKAPSAVYDAESGALLIPDSQRWPLLYERALTLASGLLPDRADNAAWLRYPNLPRGVAETLCGKLNVNLTEN